MSSSWPLAGCRGERALLRDHRPIHRPGLSDGRDDLAPAEWPIVAAAVCGHIVAGARARDAPPAVHRGADARSGLPD
ncbi:hypothetical protein [Paenibacillus sp. E194]|uniref:hypothetical protein n=1 Tax=Paenibacillus sp. E194 TaxID=1458845 RepID=UPI001E31A2A0|nr:hypothetical protein [Paenibacillus sp. E194]